ncbi:putative ferredoxin subunit of phenylpropionate dioxygenase [Actinacidiphila reveromycinica]|uniref:Putative ferredoxin subunit of phenylpropionate dioxygenase n=1 Tax=Actinacidiphila reveromycinica TaxID=659352 RepID=A0A7U3VMA3_9ACTN|nr:non-heme iron oxygenase ferredoxin subunit [Streptomyces sp. SN-593]BBA96369.1 putative ferredoxin subunit of phenylpropionate dioxygenase [Streptomyces sp. SN-593]
MSFVKVCPEEKVPADGAIAVEVEGTPIVLARSGGTVYAVGELCSHAEVSLAEGEVYDGTIECWLHGSCFDLRTGAPSNPPATRPITTYRVKVEDGYVHVAPDAGAPA